MIFKYLNSRLKFDKAHIGKITNKKRAIIEVGFIFAVKKWGSLQ